MFFLIYLRGLFFLNHVNLLKNTAANHAFEHLEKLLYDQDESARMTPSCSSPPLP